jgi:fatty-acyl-CoA synthase
VNAILRQLVKASTGTHRGLIAAPVDDDGRSRLDELRTTSWAQVHEQGLRVAGALQEAGVGEGDAVAVLAGAPIEIAPLVQGIWMCGASVTTLHHPTHRSDLSAWLADLGGALAAVGASTVVVGSPFLAAAPAVAEIVPRTLRLPDCLAGPEGRVVGADDDALAFLQLTSGSTGKPKAVAITYRNVDTNLWAVIERSGADAVADVGVSWLPLHHDMGMIGLLVVPMCLGMDLALVTPVDFLSDPLLWAELITKHRGSMTAAPNFAYGLLARRLRKAPDGAYDLSSLRFALNGAEAVNLATLDTLAAEGARFGLRREALVPAYGMAEATLAISFARPGERCPRADPGPDDAAVPGGTVQPRVALGPPLRGCEVRVVTDDGSVAGPSVVGELEIRGDSVTSRYRTAEGFEPARDEDGWLRTGDLGYLTDDGEPVVCGRTKDILIVSGRNVYPEDIEGAVAGVPGLKPGGVAMVRLRAVGAAEGFVVVAESALHADDAEAARIRSQVADKVYRRVGLSPRRVHVVPAGWIPKTSSGKLRRSETSERLRQQGLHT